MMNEKIKINYNKSFDIKNLLKLISNIIFFII